MNVDEQGNIEPTVKLRKDDEIGGLHLGMIFVLDDIDVGKNRTI